MGVGRWDWSRDFVCFPYTFFRIATYNGDASPTVYCVGFDNVAIEVEGPSPDLVLPDSDEQPANDREAIELRYVPDLHLAHRCALPYLRQGVTSTTVDRSIVS